MKTDYTKGPWRQGMLLYTKEVAKMPQSWKVKQASEELLNVFANFNTTDEGKSRRLVCKCENNNDARLIAQLPNLLDLANDYKQLLDLIIDDDDLWDVLRKKNIEFAARASLQIDRSVCIKVIDKATTDDYDDLQTFF